MGTDMVRVKRLSAILLVGLMLLAVIPSCGPKLRQMSTVRVEDNICYKDDKTGREFEQMSLSFSPVALKEPYAELKLGNTTVTMYEIDGLDPEKWLATEDGVVFREKSIQEKKASELHLTRADVFASNGSPIVIERITDADALAGLIPGKEEDSFDLPLETPAEIYLLKLVSQECPQLYYTVRYLIYGQPVEGYSENSSGTVTTGRHVIYDIYAKTCRWAPEGLQTLIEGTD